MNILIKNFFENLFRIILGPKENIVLKEKSCEKQDITPSAEIIDDKQIKVRRINKAPVTPQDELGLHDQIPKETHDHNKITKDSSFFRDNFHKYIPDETKDDFYGKQVKSRKRDTIEPQAELDLHGMTSTQAQRSLKYFIENSRRRDIRHVLIIVGKGNHSKDGRAVLHPMVGKWLNGEGKKHISKYENAPPKLGGSGAIQVWLKCNRLR
jgi:DNA-nicking Smr family endonuclease